MEKEVNGPPFVADFEDFGVQVYIDGQEDEKLLVISDPLPSYPFLVNKSPEENKFDLIRLVINFKVKEDAEGNPVRVHFDPPMEVEVDLTKFDIKHVESPQDLKVAYWDESNSTWVVFPPGTNCAESDKNCVEIVQIGDNEYQAKVWIWDWSDATMGVGR